MIGIMSAMIEEIQALVEEMGSPSKFEEGMRTYYQGKLWGTPCVLVFSRWGKVAAATTATHLISDFGVSEILFTGVAGGADVSLQVGDVVIGTSLHQHDMDARPLFERHVIPLLNRDSFETNPTRREKLRQSAETFLTKDLRDTIAEEDLKQFQIRSPKAVEAEIASGDKFFANKHDLAELKERLPGVACVEMEGAAVAQVCFEYKVPFTVVRTISDAANEGAPIDFLKFTRKIASQYSHGILRRYLEK